MKKKKLTYGPNEVSRETLLLGPFSRRCYANQRRRPMLANARQRRPDSEEEDSSRGPRRNVSRASGMTLFIYEL